MNSVINKLTKYQDSNLIYISKNTLLTFTIVFKRLKHLGINLTKEVRDFYTENYKIWLKEINDLNKKKGICVHE